MKYAWHVKHKGLHWELQLYTLAVQSSEKIITFGQLLAYISLYCIDILFEKAHFLNISMTGLHGKKYFLIKKVPFPNIIVVSH